MKKLNKQGFTLAELMIVLLIISIILAAMAPVITTRIKSGSVDIPTLRELDGKIFDLNRKNAQLEDTVKNLQQTILLLDTRVRRLEGF